MSTPRSTSSTAATTVEALDLDPFLGPARVVDVRGRPLDPGRGPGGRSTWPGRPGSCSGPAAGPTTRGSPSRSRSSIADVPAYLASGAWSCSAWTCPRSTRSTARTCRTTTPWVVGIAILESVDLLEVEPGRLRADRAAAEAGGGRRLAGPGDPRGEPDRPDRGRISTRCRLTGIWTARPPSDVSLYLVFMSWAVAHIDRMTASRVTLASWGRCPGRCRRR